MSRPDPWAEWAEWDDEEIRRELEAFDTRIDPPRVPDLVEQFRLPESTLVVDVDE